MKEFKSHSQKIASLVEAFSELTDNDIEEAKAAILAAGKDPDLIVQKGMQRLAKIRGSKKAPTVERKTNDNGAEISFLELEIVTKTIRKCNVADPNTLDSDEVIKVLIKKMPIKGVAYANLQFQNFAEAIKVNRFSCELILQIHFGVEEAHVDIFLVNLSKKYCLRSENVNDILECGYLVIEETVFLIDKDSIFRVKSILSDTDNPNVLPLQTALKIFAERNHHPWVTFIPDELNIQSIFSSNAYSADSALFIRELYSYQKQGVQWLQYCCINHIGGILGDDMGLGKTAQTIALISWIIEKKIFQHVLIVVPSTLIPNWNREFEFFSPSIVPFLHYGTDRIGSITELSKHSVVITSYSLAINDRYLLNKINWGLTVVDEASLIKNPFSERRIALSQIPSQVRIAMTGTPVENSLIDLWSIADYVNPGFLGTNEDFSSRYIRSSIEQTLEDSDLAELKKDVSFVMLRRRKEDVLESLPEKIDIHQLLVMGKFEAALYEQRRLAILESPAKGAQILKLILDLRQYTTHPFLADPIRLKNADITELRNNSVKFQRTLELLGEIAVRKEKVLIFTEYLSMIDTFKRVLEEQFRINVFTIDGRVETIQRQVNIDSFTATEGFGIMILNPRTAGMGLNITAANHVIHYTRQWNPALEEQATARAYRNKQTKGVNVYYLYYGETIEEVIDARLRAKSTLSGEVISSTQLEDESMTEYLNILIKSPIKTK